MPQSFRNLLFIGLMGGLLLSFRGNPHWVELASGLAFFLFGMQCMNEGLQALAGGRLERILARSTATPLKGLFFGIGSTMILQSTTVVSLLTIAFINTSLITLAGGITIILGANLGASSGVWLLALAGQNISLGAFAYPMIVLGVVASFNGKKSRALGRVLLGIAFILLAIDLIKNGFSAVSAEINFAEYQIDGLLGILLFTLIGLLITVVLQSSHATLMLVLTALSLNQIDLTQSFALAIGAIIGSAVTTGIVGFLGGERSGRRLALAHVIFNLVTGALSLILIKPLALAVSAMGDSFNLNSLIQLALFHTLFNIMGVLLFWVLKERLERLLCTLIPDEEDSAEVITQSPDLITKQERSPIRARYLNDSALASTETALSALRQELRILNQTTLEIICHAINADPALLSAPEMVVTLRNQDERSVDELYQHYVKGIYSDIFTFIGKIEYTEEQTDYQERLLSCQISALKLVTAIKNGEHLERNFHQKMIKDESEAGLFYHLIQEELLHHLHTLYHLSSEEFDVQEPISEMMLEAQKERFTHFHQTLERQLLIANRKHRLDGHSTSSLMNDLTLSQEILRNLYAPLSINELPLFTPLKEEENLNNGLIES